MYKNEFEIEQHQNYEQEDEPVMWECGKCKECLIGKICQYSEIFRVAAQ